MIIEIASTGVLGLQAFSHGVAFSALIRDARSDVLPALPVRSWLLATLGFAAAAISVWDVLFPGVTWQPLAAAGAVISTLGIVLFSGIWPGAPNRKLSKTDTTIALVVNAAIFVVVLVGRLTGAGLGG